MPSRKIPPNRAGAAHHTLSRPNIDTSRATGWANFGTVAGVSFQAALGGLHPDPVATLAACVLARPAGRRRDFRFARFSRSYTMHARSPGPVSVPRSVRAGRNPSGTFRADPRGRRNPEGFGTDRGRQVDLARHPGGNRLELTTVGDQLRDRSEVAKVELVYQNVASSHVAIGPADDTHQASRQRERHAADDELAQGCIAFHRGGLSRLVAVRAGMGCAP